MLFLGLGRPSEPQHNSIFKLVSGDSCEKESLELQAVQAGIRWADKASAHCINTINTKDPKEKNTTLSSPVSPRSPNHWRDFNHLGLVKTQDFCLQVRTLNKGPSVTAIFFCQSWSILSITFLKA